MVAHLAVVSDMRARHEVVVLADASWCVGLCAVGGEAFAKDIVVANLEASAGLVRVRADILWWCSE